MNNKLEKSLRLTSSQTTKMSLSIVTLTQNRCEMLKECLASLVGQIGDGDEIVLVDNDSRDQTRSVVALFGKNLPIRYFKTSVVGYPELYNFAIKKSTKDIIVFFDDDCIAGKNYTECIRRAHVKHPNKVIQGMTYSLPHHNIYAETMGDHYKNWLQINMIGDNYLRTFDNKNASVSRSILKKHGLFSETLTSGSEDIELGIRLRRNGVSIIFNPTIVAYHHERSTLQGFLQQHLRIARSERNLDGQLEFQDKQCVLYRSKLFLHIQSAMRREVLYLMQGRIGDFFLLPLLYVFLFGIRIWGYLTVR